MPVVVYGTDYWNEVINFDALVKQGVIDAEDISLIHFSNEPQEAFSYLSSALTNLYMKSKNGK
jgi:hypothetical protein